jgi:hypothetical protein
MLIALIELTVQWGNAAEWVGGVGTALAFAVTLYIITRDHADRRQQAADTIWNDALLVTVSAGQTGGPPNEIGMTTTWALITVVNGSRKPISDIHVTAYTNNGELFHDFTDPRVPPHASIRETCPATQAVWTDHNTFFVSTILTFTQANGSRWQRTSEGDIKKL